MASSRCGPGRAAWCGAHGAGDEARTVGSGKLIGDFAGELRGGEVDLAHFVAEFELA